MYSMTVPPPRCPALSAHEPLAGGALGEDQPGDNNDNDNDSNSNSDSNSRNSNININGNSLANGAGCAFGVCRVLESSAQHGTSWHGKAQTNLRTASLFSV